MERGYENPLPSKLVARVVPVACVLMSFVSSHRLERGLPRVHEATVFERGNGCLPLETREDDRAFRRAPKARTTRPNGHGRPCRDADLPLIGWPITTAECTAMDAILSIFSPLDVFSIVLQFICVCISILHTSFPWPHIHAFPSRLQCRFTDLIVYQIFSHIHAAFLVFWAFFADGSSVFVKILLHAHSIGEACDRTKVGWR